MTLEARVQHLRDAEPADDTASLDVPVVTARPDLVPEARAAQASGPDRVAAEVVVRNVGDGSHAGLVTAALTGSGAATVAGERWVCTGLTCRTLTAVPPGEELPPLRFEAPLPDTPGRIGLAGVSATVITSVEAGSVARTGAATLPVTRPRAPSGSSALPTPVVRGPALVAPGANFSWDVQVVNGGGAPMASAPEVSLSRADAVTGLGWTCEGQLCTYARALDPGESTAALLVPDAAPGVAPAPQRTLLVSASGLTASGVVLVGGPAADLAVHVPGQPRLLAGESATVPVWTRNVGAAPVVAPVRLELSGDTPLSASGSGWTCAGRVCTHPGPIGPGQSLPPVQVAVRAPSGEQPGELALQAAVSGPVDASAGDSYTTATGPLAAALPPGGDGMPPPTPPPTTPPPTTPPPTTPPATPPARAVARTLGTAGPLSSSTVAFDRDVTSAGAVQLRTATGAQVPVSRVCGSAAGAVVPCDGPARGVQVTPLSRLVPGASYRLLVVEAPGVSAWSGSLFRAATTLQGRDIIAFWPNRVDAKAVGGSFRQATPGASFATTFTGTAARWWYLRGPDLGVVRVTIDGRRIEDLNQYEAVRRGRLARTYGGLSAGPHTMTITVLTRQGSVDAVSAPTSTCTSAVGCTASPAGAYALRVAARSGASGGTVVTDAGPGTWLHQGFAGTGVDAYVTTGPGWGVLEMRVDGRRIATVSLAAAGPGRRRLTSPPLSAGGHTVTLVTVRGATEVDALVIR